MHFFPLNILPDKTHLSSHLISSGNQSWDSRENYYQQQFGCDIYWLINKITSKLKIVAILLHFIYIILLVNAIVGSAVGHWERRCLSTSRWQRWRTSYFYTKRFAKILNELQADVSRFFIYHLAGHIFQSSWGWKMQTNLLNIFLTASTTLQ